MTVARTRALFAAAAALALLGTAFVARHPLVPVRSAVAPTSTTAPPTTAAASPGPPPTTTTTTPTTEAPPPAVPAAGSGQPAAAPCVPAPMPAVAASTDVAFTKGVALSYSETPGGPPAGVLAPATWGNPTVRPVVGSAPGWVQLALGVRPNGSTGWVPEADVSISQSAYEIVVSTCRRSLTLFQNGVPIYSSPVGVGRPAAPTPPGPSFVSAIVATPQRQLGLYGPTVLILGSHSTVYTDFDGGDGTVAIHGYPSDPASTEGVASSHGCVRASPGTINAVKVVPIGTPVDIIS